MQQDIILIGDGGHSKVIMDILHLNRFKVTGYTAPSRNEKIHHATWLGIDETILQYSISTTRLINGLGSVGYPERRMQIYQFFVDSGYTFMSLVHPSAIVSEQIHYSDGVQIMAGAIVQPGTVIGHNTIVNTKASIDHDCSIGCHVHIAPGSTLCGNVTIGDHVHIGAGATIIQGVTVASNSVVGAGAVVVKDVREGEVVVGVPARGGLRR